MSPKETVESRNCEFMYKILHLLPLFYPIFTCLDRIRIPNTDPDSQST